MLLYKYCRPDGVAILRERSIWLTDPAGYGDPFERESDAVVNKVLGATRGNVVRVFALEYALLGTFSAALATIVGIAGAYAIIKLAGMDVGFGVDPVLVLGVLAGSVVLTIVTGALTTWSALSTRPAQYLRALG